MAAVRRRTDSKVVNLDNFICSVCREILKSPTRLPCSHLFCNECIRMSGQLSGQSQSQSCPYCRQSFSPSHLQKAHDVQLQIQSSFAKCKFCNEKYPLRRLQIHLDECTDKELSSNVDKAMASLNFGGQRRRDQGREDRGDLVSGFARSRQAQGQDAFGSIPSVASTFDCPCCNVTRLGRESLLQHVITHHQGTNPQVVCPICAAMPWGEPNKRSGNFVQHIQLRHKFDYDRFVDMTQDEDTVYKEVLQRSMYEQGSKY